MLVLTHEEAHLPHTGLVLPHIVRHLITQLTDRTHPTTRARPHQKKLTPQVNLVAHRHLLLRHTLNIEVEPLHRHLILIAGEQRLMGYFFSV